jgi:hypothetical protein
VTSKEHVTWLVPLTRAAESLMMIVVSIGDTRLEKNLRGLSARVMPERDEPMRFLGACRGAQKHERGRHRGTPGHPS